MTGPTRAPATLAADLAALLGEHVLGEYDAPGEPECVACSCGWQWDWREVVLPSAVDFDPARYRMANVVRPEQHRRHLAEVIARAGHLVTLDAALDWVAEQLAPLLAEWRQKADGHKDRALSGEASTEEALMQAACGGIRALCGADLAAALAALRDRAASPAPQPDTTHDTKEQP